MADDFNALLSSRSGQLPAPVVLNPLAAMSSAAQTAGNIYSLREKQAQEAVGEAFRGSIDPATGQPNQSKFMQTIAGDPRTSMYAQRGAQEGITLDTHTYDLHSKRLDSVMSGGGQLIADNPNGIPAEALRAYLDQQRKLGNLSEQEYQAAIGRISDNPRANSQFVLQGIGHGLQAKTALDAAKPAPRVENIGGQLVTVQPSGQSTSSPTPSLSQGSGSVVTSASPDTIVSLPDITYPATQADVQAGRASEVGQTVRMSGADRIRQFGIGGLLPPGAREVPGTGGGGRGGVVNSDGKPVGPNNQPRLLIVPGSGATTTAAPAPATPAPPAALPVPPVPPASTAPAPATPAPVAPAPAPAPVVPSVNAPTDSMTPGPRAALSGGVSVASTNPLLAPAVGTASAPSPAVAGDVNAILAGMRNAQTTGRLPGQQVAGATFATGPGYDEQTTAKVSQDRLASDKTLAANYAANVFPQTQALAALGRGVTTAPGADLANMMKGWAGGFYRSLGGTGLFDSTKDFDEVHKWYNQIAAGNPIAAGSDARLATVLAGNANTGIHELAGADMMKAGIALMRMNATASNQWDTDPAIRAKYGYYTNYLRDFNKTVDPRAFAWDMYNTAQKKDLYDDLEKHRSDPTYAKKLEDSLNMVRSSGYMGEIRAMPNAK